MVQDVFDRLGDEILTHQSLGSGSGSSNGVHSLEEAEEEDLVRVDVSTIYSSAVVRKTNL